MHHDLDPVQRIAFGIMVANEAIVRHDFPIVPGHIRIVVDDQTVGRRGQLLVDLDAQLAFGKGANLAFDLLAAPRLHPRETKLLHLDQRIKILDPQGAEDGLPLEVFEIQLLHWAGVPCSMISIPDSTGGKSVAGVSVTVT